MAYYAEKGDMDGELPWCPVCLSHDSHVISGAVKCALVMTDVGLRLRRVAFRFLLKTSRQVGEEGVASDNEEGVANDNEEGVDSSNEESVAISESDDEDLTSGEDSDEEGVANSRGNRVTEDVERLLAHLEVWLHV